MAKILIVTGKTSMTNVVNMLDDMAQAFAIKDIQDVKAKIEIEPVYKRKLYKKVDILAKLNAVINLIESKGNTINLRQAANVCSGVDCSDCAFNYVVETYDLFNESNIKLLRRVRDSVAEETAPIHFRSVENANRMLFAVCETVLTNP